jgi:hypothetical protein
MEPFHLPNVHLAREVVTQALHNLEEAQQSLAKVRALEAKLREWQRGRPYCPKCLGGLRPLSALGQAKNAVIREPPRG